MRPVRGSVSPDDEDLGIGFGEMDPEEHVETVAGIDLPPAIAEVIDEADVLGDREPFTWKWMYHIYDDMLTLETVPEEHARLAHETKFLLGTFVTLADDLAEKHGDRETFWEVCKVVLPGVTPDWDREGIREGYARSVRRVWSAIEERFEQAPRYGIFREPFEFDMRVALEGMDFTRLSESRFGHGNRVETWRYETAGIGMLTYVDADLMFSPGFDLADYGPLRELVVELQRMWRIGNWVITWKREVGENDFTAGVFVEAVRNGVVTGADIEAVRSGDRPPEYVIDRIEDSGVVEQFAWDWKRRREELRARDFDVDSLDPNALVGSIEDLMRSQLATEGYR